MSEPQDQETPEPQPAPEPPAGPEAPAPVKGRQSKVTRAAAIAAVFGVSVAAMAFQNLWHYVGPLLEESRATTGLLPLVVLGGVTVLVSLTIVALVLKRLGRLLRSVRMTVALLIAVALLSLASTPFETESSAGLRGPASERNDESTGELFEPLLGKQRGQRAGEKVMILVRTAGLTDLSRSWTLHTLLALLALCSAAGLIWRRPVGAREFGFLAAHAGVLLILGGSAVGAVFGTHQTDLTLSSGGQPRPIPGGPAEDAAFTMRIVKGGISLEEFPAEYRVLGRLPGWKVHETLALDALRPGSRTRWRGLDVEVLEFRPDAVPEAYVEDAARDGRPRNPAVRVELLAGSQSREMVLYMFSAGWRKARGVDLEISFERHASPAQADAACRRPRAGEMEKLVVLSAKGRRADETLLKFGRAKVGETIALRRLGLRLEVLRWFSGARVSSTQGIVQAPPVKGVPPAIEVRPIPDVVDPKLQKPPSFWIMGGKRPTEPRGEVPAKLTRLKFLYDPQRWQPFSIRIVEGPRGEFQLAELLDGKMIKIRRIAVGQTLKLELGRSLRLVEFIKAARPAYRPGEPGSGAATEPAVRLAVSRGAIGEDFWFFPGRSAAQEAAGASFAVRALQRGRRRETVTIEVAEEGKGASKVVIERGRPLSRGGYSVHLTGVKTTGQRDGKVFGLVSFTVDRTPGLWVIYLGMVLVALGAPWLLWSRFRRVPDPVNEEG